MRILFKGLMQDTNYEKSSFTTRSNLRQLLKDIRIAGFVCRSFQELAHFINEKDQPGILGYG